MRDEQHVPVRPQDHHAAAGVPRRGGQSRSRRPMISGPCGSPRRSPPARSSSRPSTATTCRCSSASWRRCAISGCTRMLHPGRRRPAGARPRRRAGCAPTCRASTSPTRSSSASKGAQDQKHEGKQLCIELIQRDPRDPTAWPGVHVMAYRQEELVAENHRPASGRHCGGPRRPGTAVRDQGQQATALGHAP